VGGGGKPQGAERQGEGEESKVMRVNKSHLGLPTEFSFSTRDSITLPKYTSVFDSPEWVAEAEAKMKELAGAAPQAPSALDRGDDQQSSHAGDGGGDHHSRDAERGACHLD
jgi:hypothetical protein